MNHSNLLDLKQMRLLWFHGVVSLLGFRRKSGVFSMFAVWHWLLCSWPLSPFPVSLATLLPVFLSFYPLSCSTWKLHGLLCVCVHVCACIYMYREIYMSGLRGREWSTAQGLQPGHCPVEPVICPFCVGEIKGRCGWVPLLSSLQVVFLDVRQMADSTTVFLIFFSPPL